MAYKLPVINDQVIKNPVILNIAISNYGSNELGDLSTTLKDRERVHRLWIDVYGYDEEAIIENDAYEDEDGVQRPDGYVDRDHFLELVREARTIFSPTRKVKKERQKLGLPPHDSLIVCYSGHGSLHGILTSEWNGKSLPNGQVVGEVKIKQITDMFTGSDINRNLLDSARIMIMDACRGSEEAVAVKRRGGKGTKLAKMHPAQDIAIIHSNTLGMKSFESDDNEGGHLILALDKILRQKQFVSKTSLATLVKYIRYEVLRMTQSTQCVDFASTLTSNIFIRSPGDADDDEKKNNDDGNGNDGNDELVRKLQIQLETKTVSEINYLKQIELSQKKIRELQSVKSENESLSLIIKEQDELTKTLKSDHLKQIQSLQKQVKIENNENDDDNKEQEICAAVQWDLNNHHKHTVINGKIAKCTKGGWADRRNVFVEGTYNDETIKTFVFRLNKHGHQGIFFGMKTINSMTDKMGKHKNEFSLDSCDGNLINNDSNLLHVGRRLSPGDIIKIVLNDGRIRFSVNDCHFCISFRFKKNTDFKIGVSLFYKDDEVEIL